MSQMKKATIFFLQNIIKFSVVFFPTRLFLNATYHKLSPSQRIWFHRQFAEIFRNTEIHVRDGFWTIFFREKKILMFLGSEQLWLDWELAVSIIGNDVEIKETYDALLSSDEPPSLFIDIGANYGTHSLIFLTQNIETITFEPNSACYDYFIDLCKLNGVTPNLEKVALGEQNSFVELSYPECETWLGSINTEVIENLAFSHKLVKAKVEQKMLDEYFEQIEKKQPLIKIDTEGNELAVLRGAVKTLRVIKPKIIFESRGGSERIELFEFFKDHKYKIYHLPWKLVEKNQFIEPDKFMRSSSTNFIAVPMEN